MSISTAARQISHHWTGMHHFSIIPSIPLASSSRSPFRYSSTSTSTSTFPNPSRKIYAQAQPSAEAGFESIPPPMYSGPVDSASSIGKGKGKENHVVKEEPRRKVSIRSKKAAISMTPAALDRLRALVSSPTEPLLLRIGVKTRGCAGMAYHLDYVPPPGGKFDEIVEQDGVRVLIDSKALFSIIGSKMDWRDNRLSAGFVFDNPNVVDTCGCGESFNIQV